MAKWLDKYDTPQAQNGIEGTMGGLTDVGFNYNGAWGGTMQMGGVLPGAVGFTYARTQSPAPSNGPYAKKTKASAQNGQEMKYYQEGLDFKPKTISQNGSAITTDINDYRRWQDSVRNYIRGQKDLATARTNVKKNIDSFSLMSGSGLVGAFSNLIEGDIQGKRRFLPEYKEQSLPRQYWIAEEKYPQMPKDVIIVGDPAFDTSRKIKGLTKALEENKNLTKTNFYPYSEVVEIYHPPVRKSLKYQPPAKKKQTSRTIGPFPLPESKKLAKPIPIPREAIDLGYELPVPGAPRLIETSKFENKPTKFSFTYPSGKYNEQKTMYFPSKAALKSFVGSIRDASYQEGADYASATGTLQDGGDIPVDPMGYWNPENVGNPVIIPSTDITMEGVDQPLIGISDTGDVQYMEPGEDYEFDGEYVTEYPVAQNGTATRADSIMVLKNAILKNAFYKNNPNYVKINPTVNFKNPQVLKSLAQASVNAKRRYSSAYPDDSYKILPARDSKEFIITAGDIKRRVGKVAGSSDVYSAPDILYENDIDTYFNPASPPVFFSPSILPQGSVMYNSSAESGYGDISSSPYYDPIAVSPWDMLTPQQQKVRLQKYGTSGTPYSKPSKQLPTPSTKPKPASKPVAAKPTPKPTVTPQKDKKIITGSKKEFDKYNNESPLILDKDGIYRNDMGIAFRFEKPTPPPVKKKVVTPAPEPVEESKVVPVTPETVRKTILSTVPSGGMGIFGPGNTRIGEYDESTNTFYPDYENLAGRKKVNQPDIDLLADQEKLSNFITSKTGKKPKINVKQRNGGVNKADEYPIEKLDQLLNFTNYNKPTKGGWLDKYN